MHSIEIGSFGRLPHTTPGLHTQVSLRDYQTFVTGRHTAWRDNRHRIMDRQARTLALAGELVSNVGQVALSQTLGVSRPTVRRSLARLLRLGWILQRRREHVFDSALYTYGYLKEEGGKIHELTFADYHLQRYRARLLTEALKRNLLKPGDKLTVKVARALNRTGTAKEVAAEVFVPGEPPTRLAMEALAQCDTLWAAALHLGYLTVEQYDAAVSRVPKETPAWLRLERPPMVVTPRVPVSVSVVPATTTEHPLVYQNWCTDRSPTTPPSLRSVGDSANKEYISRSREGVEETVHGQATEPSPQTQTQTPNNQTKDPQPPISPPAPEAPPVHRRVKAPRLTTSYFTHSNCRRLLATRMSAMGSSDVLDKPTSSPVGATSTTGSTEETDGGLRTAQALAAKLREARKVLATDQHKKSNANARRRENLNGRKSTSEQKAILASLAATWTKGFEEQFPGVPVPKWILSGEKRMLSLVETHGTEAVDRMLEYVTTCWESVNKRYFKGNALFPTSNMLAAIHESLCGESHMVEQHYNAVRAWEAELKLPEAQRCAEKRRSYTDAVAALHKLGLKV